jgi:hypothetical protein
LLSWSEHFCHDDDGGGASPELPKVEDPDAAGEAALAMVVERKREEEIARKKKAESSGDLSSWLRRRKALESSGTGWLLRTVSPVKIPRALQWVDPKLTAGFRWAGDLAVEEAG